MIGIAFFWSNFIPTTSPIQTKGSFGKIQAVLWLPDEDEAPAAEMEEKRHDMARWRVK